MLNSAYTVHAVCRVGHLMEASFHATVRGQACIRTHSSEIHGRPGPRAREEGSPSSIMTTRFRSQLFMPARPRSAAAGTTARASKQNKTNELASNASSSKAVHAGPSRRVSKSTAPLVRVPPHAPLYLTHHQIITPQTTPPSGSQHFCPASAPHASNFSTASFPHNSGPTRYFSCFCSRCGVRGPLYRPLVPRPPLPGGVT